MLTPNQQSILDGIIIYGLDTSTSEELTEIIDNWHEFQSNLLKRIVDIRDSLKEDIESDADEEPSEDRL